MTTVDKIEVDKFSKLADEWWNPNGKFKPLHLFNPARIEIIKETLINHFKLKNDVFRPLKNLKILDIGCGGGLLCEPLSRLGADMTGIDASENNINVAKLHAKEMGLNIKYLHSSPENLKFANEFDVILNMEVVEHVSDVNLFLKNCSKLIKKNGIMFVATINKNLKSYFFAIVGAEYILRWLPIGTHEWEKFVKPEDLKKNLIKYNLILQKFDGMHFNLIEDEWRISSNLSVNYIGRFIKN